MHFICEIIMLFGNALLERSAADMCICEMVNSINAYISQFCVCCFQWILDGKGIL